MPKLPNSARYLSTIDFTTALARLLRDPAQREAFARDTAGVTQQLHVRADDRAAFERLVPEELEAQAMVLLRKRFREVEVRLPSTCAAHGPGCWRLFLAHARRGWPASASADALSFCEWLRERGERVSVREYNRQRFVARSGRLAIHLVDGPSAGSLPMGQLLIRRGRRISELSLRFGW